MNSPNYATSGGLAELRTELDDIDRALLQALRDRLQCCIRIAEYKREHEIPMMQPQRVELVLQRAEDYAVDHRMDPGFIRSLYELIIDQTCRVEDAIIGGASISPDRL